MSGARRVLATGAGLVLFASVLSGCSEASFYEMSGMVYRDAGGTITVGGTMDVFDLVVGDCFANDGEGEDGKVSSVRAIPCDEPHPYEVFHVFSLPWQPYPGDDAVLQAADDGCYAEFEDFFGAPYEVSPVDFSHFTPLEGEWKGGRHDRMVQCFVVPEADVTGTLADSGRQVS